MANVHQTGNFRKTERFLNNASRRKYLTILEKYGQIGVDALSSATPKDSGLTSESWGYVIIQKNGKTTITWTNSHIVDGVPIVILLQYGHATLRGGFVDGVDYINPTMKPIFENLAADIWKEVKSL